MAPWLRRLSGAGDESAHNGRSFLVANHDHGCERGSNVYRISTLL